LSQSRSRQEIAEKAPIEKRPLATQLKEARRSSHRPKIKEAQEINILTKQWNKEDDERVSLKSNGSIHSNFDPKDERNPMLVFDIYLGEQKGMKHLLVFEEDQPNAIAKKFKQRHGMDDKQRLKLEALLQLKMLNQKRKKV